MPRPLKELTYKQRSDLRTWVEDGDMSVKDAAALLGLPFKACRRYCTEQGIRASPGRRDEITKEDADGVVRRLCRSCGKRRPLERFDVDLTKAHGRGYTCLRCKRDDHA